MYDLGQSIINWKSAISNDGRCSTDEVEELETHLRDQIADLVDVGLSEQEAFTIAVSRLGVPNELCSEYEKASPMRLWRKRIFALFLAVPALGFGAFTAVFLLPKLLAVWEGLGIEVGQRWILEIPVVIFESLFHYGVYALIALIFAMILFDARAKSPSRYRYLPFSVIAHSVNFAVFIGITCVGIGFALVAPAIAS